MAILNGGLAFTGNCITPEPLTNDFFAAPGIGQLTDRTGLELAGNRGPLHAAWFGVEVLRTADPSTPRREPSRAVTDLQVQGDAGARQSCLGLARDTSRTSSRSSNFTALQSGVRSATTSTARPVESRLRKNRSRFFLGGYRPLRRAIFEAPRCLSSILGIPVDRSMDGRYTL